MRAAQFAFGFDTLRAKFIILESSAMKQNLRFARLPSVYIKRLSYFRWWCTDCLQTFQLFVEFVVGLESMVFEQMECGV